MGFLDRVTMGAPNLDLRHGMGLGSHLVETGEYLGFSYLAGRVNTQYGERAEWRGHNLTYVAGVAGKVAAVAADIFGFGSGWSHHANTAANALLGAEFCARGARDGLEAAKKSGQKASDKNKSTASLGGTSLGAIPPAPQPGRFLDLEKCAAIAAMNG